MTHIVVDHKTQELTLFDDDRVIKRYLISTAKNGMGEIRDSEKTPRGKHIIRVKIGEGQPRNTVFVGRRPTGEIFTPELFEQFPGRDWILTRIMWLSGLEVSKNRLGNVDTMSRYVYIHGSPAHAEMGNPGSRGCIRMRNQDIVELFQLVTQGTLIEIT